MKNHEKEKSTNKEKNEKGISEDYLEPQKLGEEEKKKLQVKDGQNNHHVDERGGF